MDMNESQTNLGIFGNIKADLGKSKAMETLF